MAPLAGEGGLPDDTIAWHLWVGVLTTAIPATIAVTLRFYARILGKLPLRADDWLIVGSLVCLPLRCIVSYTSPVVTDGFRNHVMFQTAEC